MTPRRVLEAAQAGERAAFEQLMRRHERLVLRTAWRLSGNPEAAQAVAQESFGGFTATCKKSIRPKI